MCIYLRLGASLDANLSAPALFLLTNSKILALMGRVVLKTVICFSMAFCLWSCSCRQEKALDYAEELIMSSPDSALSVLRRLEVHGPANMARYGILCNRAAYVKYMDSVFGMQGPGKSDDGLLSHGTGHGFPAGGSVSWPMIINKSAGIPIDSFHVARAMRFYEGKRNSCLLAENSFYRGLIYERRGEKDEALRSYFLSEMYRSECRDSVPFLFEAGLYNALARMSFDQYDNAAALKYFTKALRESDGKHPGLWFETLYGRTLCRMLDGDYEGAASDIDDLSEYAYSSGSAERICRVMILYNRIRRKTDFNKDSIIAEKRRIFDMAGIYGGTLPKICYGTLGIMYYDLGVRDSAEYYLAESMKDPYSTHMIGRWLMLAELAGEKKDFARAREYERNYYEYKYKRHENLDKYLYKVAEMQHENRYLKWENAYLAGRNDDYLIIMALTFVLVLITGYAAYVSWKKMSLAKRSALDSMHDIVGNMERNYCELKSKYDDMPLSRDGKLKEKLSERLRDLQMLLDTTALYESRPAAFYSIVKKMYTVTGENSGIENEIISTADCISDGKVLEITEKVPNITKHELCYVCLLRMGFGFQSMRVIFNHKNMNSIYTLRTRIRSKYYMHNPDGEDFDMFFNRIINKSGNPSAGLSDEA